MASLRAPIFEDKVIDSRSADEGAAIRRRRECLGCGRRYTTFERTEPLPLLVVKRSGSVEAFDRDKLARGIASAVAGRPIDGEAVDARLSRANGCEIARWEALTAVLPPADLPL